MSEAASCRPAQLRVMPVEAGRNVPRPKLALMASRAAIALADLPASRVASSPQVSIFSERRGPEAYVPLP